MTAYLITGNPGSGKTTMALHLAAQGLMAVDADVIAGWETPAGLAATQPEHATDEWLLGHRWVWQRERLEVLLGSQGPSDQRVFVCGIAMNQRDLLDLFDRVFLLAIDDETQLDRLDTPANAVRNEAQRAQIREGRPVFEREMREAGAVVLDGRRPTSALAEEILSQV